MKIFYTSDHEMHAPALELHRGAFVPAHEGPHRIDMLLDGLKSHDYNNLTTPDEHAINAITAVHSERYVEFLQNAWQQWQDAGYSGDVLPMTYPYQARRSDPPIDIDGKAGYYAASSDCMITETSWYSIKAGADCALSAVQYIRKNGTVALALTRPPGHHAGQEYMAGYCYLNYAAIAAQYMRNKGAAKVAILDVDFHHGNGTQDIFYTRNDVLFASLHGDPRDAFPHFLGYADEIGSGAGNGFNHNYPMKPGTGFDEWRAALCDAFGKVQDFKPDALIISLGVDTFENDPISFFKLKSDDFTTYGADIAALELPTLFVMEGGYDIDEIGINTINVLQGFDAARGVS